MSRMHKSSVLVLSSWVVLLLSGVTMADFYFGQPANLGSVVSTSHDEGVDCISYDGLELYLTYSAGGPFALGVSTRESTDDEWGPYKDLGPIVNNAWDNEASSISSNGLELYYAQFSAPGQGGNIVVSRRSSKLDPWGSPQDLGPEFNNDGFLNSAPWIAASGLELYFSSTRPGGFGSSDLYVSTRESLDADWQVPINLGWGINTQYADSFFSVSSDGLVLFISDHPTHPERPGGVGGKDIYYCRRTSTSEPWGDPVSLPIPINTQFIDFYPMISPDGSDLYFESNRPGGFGRDDAYQSSITPIVDFNRDGLVEIEDLVELINSWGQDNPRYDIGPMPWGDGIVDRADLEVLLSYWEQYANDPSLLAHWALDEAEGLFAEERVSGNMDIVLGNPTWLPEGGQIRGCLEFDGVDDRVILKPVLDPANDPFSLFAWIKGGGPGQVILSQQTGVNWFKVDTDGTLLTELAKSGGRTPGSPLYSETVITDGNWHRIGFVWDGAQRFLYVDDILVATDDQASLGGSMGGLVIGVGTDNQAGTFWSGMIDDVRIYNRAITP